MCVRGLATTTLFEMTIDNAPIFVENFYRNSTLRSCGWNCETRFHILDDLQCWTSDGNRFGANLRRDWLGLLRFCRLSFSRLGGAVAGWLPLCENFTL